LYLRLHTNFDEANYMGAAEISTIKAYFSASGWNMPHIYVHLAAARARTG
jgi:hypothetical protein